MRQACRMYALYLLSGTRVRGLLLLLPITGSGGGAGVVTEQKKEDSDKDCELI